MYSMRLDGVIVFEWDTGNLDKSRRKHGVTPAEAENVFFNEEALITPDKKHSKAEERFIILGKSDKNRDLFIIFTLRKGKVRIISARRMHRREVEKYGKIKKDTKI